MDISKERIMKRTAIFLVIIWAMAASGFAAEGKQVTYRSGDDTVTGMLYAPAKAKGKLPAIVVIHEWYGLNDWVKQQASKWADKGYVTLAVDLYRGKVAADRDEAHELMRGLPEDRATRDLKSAVAYLKTQGNVDGAKIGTIGWCMGGGFSLAAALAEPTVKATIINYGRLVTDEESLKVINAAILGIFGGKDRGIPVESVRKFEDSMKKLGKRVEIKIYDDAGHGFQNENNKDGYNKADTEDAVKLQTSFFERELKK
jgi:carboxymethylenebutenolidase